MRITESKKITDFFGCNVFNDGVMQKYMPRETYNELKEVTDLGKPLNKELANKVAKAALHPLVSAADWHHGGKARQLYFHRQVGQHRVGIYRQQSAQGRSGRVQLSVGRNPRDL